MKSHEVWPRPYNMFVIVSVSRLEDGRIGIRVARPHGEHELLPRHLGYACSRRAHLAHCKDQVDGNPMTLAMVAWVIGWVVLIVVVTLFGNRSKPIT